MHGRPGSDLRPRPFEREVAMTTSDAIAIAMIVCAMIVLAGKGV